RLGGRGQAGAEDGTRRPGSGGDARTLKRAAHDPSPQPPPAGHHGPGLRKRHGLELAPNPRLRLGLGPEARVERSVARPTRMSRPAEPARQSGMPGTGDPLVCRASFAGRGTAVARGTRRPMLAIPRRPKTQSWVVRSLA